MSQTIHLQKLHLQEMEMVFLWMWLVNRMLPSSVTVRCEGEVLKLPIKRLSRVSLKSRYVWLIMWLSSHVWKVGPSPEGWDQRVVQSGKTAQCLSLWSCIARIMK
jgi:hypothetical protein